jgi:hypothetical protein
MCFASGRCVPRSSHNTNWEYQGSGLITGANALSTAVTGEGTAFLSELKVGSTISVGTQDYQESRVVTAINGAGLCVVSHPFSFTITPGSALSYVIRPGAGRGTVTQLAANTTVTGVGTRFMRDLAPGWIIALGNQKRVVTHVVSDTLLGINAAWEQAGVQSSAYSYESCAEGHSKTYTVDVCELEPGCCGFKVVSKVKSREFAYYQIKPPNSAQHLRLMLTAPEPMLDLVLRTEVPPDAVNFDQKSEGSSGLWELSIPSSQLYCSGGSCSNIIVGIRGLPMDAGAAVTYELSAYFEFDFSSFGCSGSTASTLSAKCHDLGILQVGNATVVNEEIENKLPVLRLTAGDGLHPVDVGSAWYTELVHLESGFESTFDFRVSASDGASGADGFAFLVYGGSPPDSTLLGCPGAGLGFGNDPSAGCTDGIPNSLAVEFDTWHNPSLHDINARGSGRSSHNSTIATSHTYSHVAFFSQSESNNVVDHKYQLSGTSAVPSFNDGNVHTAKIVYIAGSETAPGRLFLYVDDMQSFVLTAAVTLARQGTCTLVAGSVNKCVLNLQGNAYLGFSASSAGSGSGLPGQSTAIHNWKYCNQPNCGR